LEQLLEEKESNSSRFKCRENQAGKKQYWLKSYLYQLMLIVEEELQDI
jgi:hypothetical protein